MRNKGFTLIELLAVVTIISLLLVLVVPKITSQLNNSKDEVNSATKKVIYRAAEKYVQDYNINQEKYESNEYCLTMKELIDENYLTNEITDNKLGINIKEKKTVRITYDDASGFDYELVDSNECDDILNHGLTPVAYKDDKWVVVSPLNKNNEWYDYDNQKWANAVTLLPGVKKEVGDEVAVDGTEASMMLVWIPRFEYKIEGTYGKGGTDAAHPGEIEVNFIGKDKTTPTSGYRIHPAFTLGDKKLNGIWVGKFEISHTTKSLGYGHGDNDYNNEDIISTCGVDCSESKNLRTLPDRPSLRYNRVVVFYNALKNVENENTFGLSRMDTHMIKNSEWGAVAYLSQSRYGKYGNSDYEGVQKEIYINNSQAYYTGRSGGNVPGNTPRSAEYTGQNDDSYLTYGYYTYDGYLLSFNTNNKTEERNIKKGTGSSTTGNIYGVYDMSGGSDEYVMGVYGTESGPVIKNADFDSDAFTSGKIENKYYNMYLTDVATTACDNGTCYGQALSETSGWYNDSNTMVNSNNPWMMRGGSFLNEATASKGVGIFSYLANTGHKNVNYSSRIILTYK